MASIGAQPAASSGLPAVSSGESQSTSSTPAEKKSLCYLEASKQWEAGGISTPEYIHHLYAHLSGAWHAEDDARDGFDYELYCQDGMALGVQCWVGRLCFEQGVQTKTRIKVLDSKPFEDVFAAYATGKRSEVVAKLKALGPYEKEITADLAYHALRAHHPGMLKLCLDRGFGKEQTFINLANALDEKRWPKTALVLNKQTDFRKSYPKKDRSKMDWADCIPW